MVPPFCLQVQHTYHAHTLPWPYCVAFEHRRYLEGTQGSSSFPLITWQYHNALLPAVAEPRIETSGPPSWICPQ